LGARLHKSFRKFQSSARGLQKAFHRLQKISVLFPESRIINGLRANRGKKIAARAVGRAWGPRAALADGSNAAKGGRRFRHGLMAPFADLAAGRFAGEGGGSRVSGEEPDDRG
jgi:hypothetical protein